MEPFLGQCFGNPSSGHVYGRKVRWKAELNHCRVHVKANAGATQTCVPLAARQSLCELGCSYGTQIAPTCQHALSTASSLAEQACPGGSTGGGGTPGGRDVAVGDCLHGLRN